MDLRSHRGNVHRKALSAWILPLDRLLHATRGVNVLGMPAHGEREIPFEVTAFPRACRMRG